MKRVKSNWTDVILVCRKCSKKLDGGFGEKGDQRLAKLLRKAFADPAVSDGKKAKGRKARMGVVEVDCLDICPKGAVVTVRASRPQDWRMVPHGMATDEVIRQLGMA